MTIAARLLAFALLPLLVSVWHLTPAVDRAGVTDHRDAVVRAHMADPPGCSLAASPCAHGAVSSASWLPAVSSEMAAILFGGEPLGQPVAEPQSRPAQAVISVSTAPPKAA